MMADLLVINAGGGRFSWGGAGVDKPAEIRARYIDALRAADQHNIGPLMDFARS